MLNLNPENRDGWKKFLSRFEDLLPEKFRQISQRVSDRRAEADWDRMLRDRQRGEKHTKAKVAVETRIDFDDECSSTSTLLQVIAQDRPRLLHRLSSCLSRQQCNIEIALIDTEGQMAIDTFYLTSEGKKLPVGLQKKVEKALLDELKGLDLA